MNTRINKNWLKRLSGCFMLAALFSFCLSPAWSVEVPNNLRVCGDLGEFPPFSYFERVDHQKTSKITGYDVDYLNAILADNGKTASFTLLPWQRCLQMAASGQFDLVLDVVKAPVRERDFAFPSLFYTLSNIYLYDTDNEPKLEKIRNNNSIHFCVPLGWDISAANIGLSAITGHPDNMEQAVVMLKAQRCDVILYSLESIRGDRQVGKYYIFDDPKIGYKPIPDIPNIEMYLVVSRAVPYQSELLHLLNEGIEKMKKSGKVKQLQAEHGLR